MTQRIDAHHHLWRLERGDYDWLTPDLEAIHRDFEPDDLKPLLDEAGVDATILVQAAATVAETRFMLDLADQTSWIRGVVGWVDFEASDASVTIAELAKHPKLVGLRPMIQNIEDDNWMLRPTLASAVATMREHGLRFDALVYPQHLRNLREFHERYPDLPVVIDHLAKPFIARGEIEPWRTDIRRLADETPMLCKLSGMATEASAAWTIDDLRPYAETVLAAFGPERVMWGSDWPVLNLAGDYARWMNTAQSLCASFNETERDAIFGGTAARFYGTARTA